MISIDLGLKIPSKLYIPSTIDTVWSKKVHFNAKFDSFSTYVLNQLFSAEATLYRHFNCIFFFSIEISNKNIKSRTCLKVKQSRNEFFKPTFLPKIEGTNWYLKSTCFCSFFGRNLSHQKDISKLSNL